MSRNINILKRIPGNQPVKVAIILFCLLIFFPVRQISAQVINNNGAAVNVTPGTYINSKDATNTAGTLSNDGNLTLTGNYTNTATTNGNGIYRIGGNWSNNGGIFSPGTSTVFFNGTLNQTITCPTGETFFNLYLSNTGAMGSNILGLANNVTVQGTLTMSVGNIGTGASRILLINPLPSALSYTSVTGSRVIGRFERGVNQTGTYLFPLGSMAHYNPANIITNSLSVAGTILSEFLTPPLIDSLGLPLPDPPDEVAWVYQDGYWNMTSNGFSSNSFNVNLDATGFTSFPVHDITRVIKRTTGGNWLLDGTHSPAAGTVVFRNSLTGNISSAGTQFALGRSRPRILSQPRDTAVCEAKPYAPSYAEFRVIATSTKALTYTWYKEPGILLTGGHYNTTGPGILIINNVNLADAGRYYCIIKDVYGTSTRSVSATLIVNKRPVATVTPNAQGNTCSNVAFANIVLGESNGVAGTSFAWYRTNPGGITTAVPLTGSIPAAGGFIPGTFTNTTDAPIRITFYITPIGPALTNCAGALDSAYVVVNPTPRIIPVNAKPQICYGGSTDITLTTPSIMTMGVIRFDYTVSVTGGPGVVVGSTAPGFNLIPGQKLSFSYQDNSDTIQSVFYSITPFVVGLGCPNGVIQVPEVKIHAKPLQGITIVKPLTCAGGSDAILRAEISKGAGPYIFHWTGPFSYVSNAQTIGGDSIWAGTYFTTVKDNLGCTNNSSQSIWGSTTSTIVSVFDSVSCFGGSDGVFRVKVDESTGIPPFSYVILKDDVDTVAQGTLNAEGVYNYHGGIAAGSYTVRMRDSQDCYELYPPQIDMPEPELIKVTFEKSWFASYNVSCKGYWDGWAKVKTINGGNNGFIYNWHTHSGSIHSGPVSNNRIDSLSAGWYVVEVTDSKGCYMIDSVQITEPDGIQLTGFRVSSSRDSIFNISCNGWNDGYIDLTVTGGSGTYNYSWTDSLGTYSSSSEDISNLRAGTYIATITDVTNTTCFLSPKPRFRLREPAVLNATAFSPPSTDGSHNINCSGGTGSVNLTVTGGSIGNYRYSWTTANGSGIIPGIEDQNALTAGNYHVVVTDTNRCVTSADIVLTEPLPLTVSLLPTHLTCTTQGRVDLTVAGGVGPYSYNWSNGAVTQNISNLPVGTYIVTVTDVNGCTRTDSAKVDPPAPVTFTSTVSERNGFNISCQGLSDGWIKINPTSGLGPFIYEWSGTGGSLYTRDISGLKAGSYHLQITDQNTCTADTDFILTEPGMLTMNLTLSQSVDGGFNISCAGSGTGSIDVNPVNNAGRVTYLWSDGDTGRLRANVLPGNYKVIILDQNNCHADSTFALTSPDSVKIVFDIRPAWCPDSPDGEIRTTVTGGIRPAGDYLYKWSDNSTGPLVTNILQGLYWVTVTDANNCSLTDSVDMEPQQETCLVIPNIFSPNGDNINDTWEIGMIDLYPNIEIKIFNRWGELVWKSAKGYPDRWDGRSNGVLLPMDSYHYIIDLHNGSKAIIGNITIVK